MSEGINGQLPNLDLVNVFVHIATTESLQVRLPSGPQLPAALQAYVPAGSQRELARFETVLGMILRQAFSVNHNAHSAFLQCVICRPRAAPPPKLTQLQAQSPRHHRSHSVGAAIGRQE